MSKLDRAVRVSLFVCLGFTGCGDERSATPGAPAGAGAGGTAGPPQAGAPQAGASGAGGAAGAARCVLASGCIDIAFASAFQKACCTPSYDCGYELPPPDEEILKDFPDAAAFHANLVKDDPNGRCVPETFFFDLRPGLWKHRVEVEDGEDILITPDCSSFSLAAYILPGCCLPDSTCGLSTDESAPSLEYIAGGSFPFTQPECVSAEVLNQQFRESVVLAGFARARAAGTCDYPALAAELPNEE